MRTFFAITKICCTFRARLELESIFPMEIPGEKFVKLFRLDRHLAVGTVRAIKDSYDTVHNAFVHCEFHLKNAIISIIVYLKNPFQDSANA
jgi:hypothetical protein